MKKRRPKKTDDICKKLISNEMMLFAAYSMTLLRSKPHLYFADNGKIHQLRNIVLEVLSHNLITYAKKNSIDIPIETADFLSFSSKEISKIVDSIAKITTDFDYLSNLLKAELFLIKNYSSILTDVLNDEELNKIVESNVKIHRENAQKIDEIIRKET